MVGRLGERERRRINKEPGEAWDKTHANNDLGATPLQDLGVLKDNKRLEFIFIRTKGSFVLLP